MDASAEQCVMRVPVRLSVLLNDRGAQGRYRVAPGGAWGWFEGVVDVCLEVGARLEVDVCGQTRGYVVRGRLDAVSGCESATINFGAGVDVGQTPGRNYRTYRASPLVARNTFRDQVWDGAPLPSRDTLRAAVPLPFWDGHEDVVDCHAAAWDILAAKFHPPESGSGFSRNFVYTEFANAIFMWGCCFITMYGHYARRAFSFIEILDNFYGAQEDDGFIPRQLRIDDGRSAFERNDPSAVGGNLLAWAEWIEFEQMRDTQRLRRVFPVLLAYHRWLRAHRTWKDGSYFSSGWGCGMDNIPRMDQQCYSPEFDHGHLSFVDVTLQQIFNARLLLRMARALDTDEGVPELTDEARSLKHFVNERMWDERSGVYHDLDRHGRHVNVRHVGAFWALLAGVASPKRRQRLLAEIENPKVFAASTGTASMAMDDPGFVANGGEYWRGGVWCITEYMIVRGLLETGMPDAAHRVARRHVEAVARVWGDTGTIWESYDPSRLAPGRIHGALVRRQFVGFSGVTPIAMFLEAVLGIRIEHGELIWDVRLLERHGVRNLHVFNTTIDLCCEARASTDEKPVVSVRSSHPVKLRVIHGTL